MDARSRLAEASAPFLVVHRRAETPTSGAAWRVGRPFTDPDRARLLLREILDNPQEMRPLLEQHVLPWAQIVANYIRKGQEAGRVRKDVDPEAYIFNMIHLLVAGIAAHQGVVALLGDQADHEEVFERHITEMVRVAKASLFEPRPAKREGDDQDIPASESAAE